MKTSNKLMASVALMVISLTLMVSVSFAWFTLSDTPAVTGIKITIGGDNTILFAQDRVVTVDGKKVHIPDYFSKNAEFETNEGLLSPVSTADGLNWFVPMISDTGEMNVSNLQNFIHDNELQYANAKDGGYALFDFWIVSPMDHTFLRISSGDETGEEIGSYVIELPEAVKDTTSTSGYSLNLETDSLASSIRVGFLVDETSITDNANMNAYMSTTTFRKEMVSLRGNYNEDSNYDFLIYEPNGLSHPKAGTSVVLTHHGLETTLPQDGEYWITRPIGLNENGEVDLIEVPNQLIVQTENQWKKNADNETTMIEDLYHGYLSRKTSISTDSFYESLDYTFLQYVSPGRFIENTWDLYLNGDLTKTSSDEVSILSQTNAVSDHYIAHLEKNIPQRIRMFVWIEGQDVDCNYNAADQTISLRLEFAGSTGA